MIVGTVWGREARSTQAAGSCGGSAGPALRHVVVGCLGQSHCLSPTLRSPAQDRLLLPAVWRREHHPAHVLQPSCLPWPSPPPGHTDCELQLMNIQISCWGSRPGLEGALWALQLSKNGPSPHPGEFLLGQWLPPYCAWRRGLEPGCAQGGPTGAAPRRCPVHTVSGWPSRPLSALLEPCRRGVEAQLPGQCRGAVSWPPPCMDGTQALLCLL